MLSIIMFNFIFENDLKGTNILFKVDLLKNKMKKPVLLAARSYCWIGRKGKTIEKDLIRENRWI